MPSKAERMERLGLLFQISADRPDGYRLLVCASFVVPRTTKRGASTLRFFVDVRLALDVCVCPTVFVAEYLERRACSERLSRSR